MEQYLKFLKSYEHQFGFRPCRSTLSLLHSLNANIIENLNNGMLSILILLDFSKAFDTLAHDILILKLYKLGTYLNILAYLYWRSTRKYMFCLLYTSPSPRD